MPSQLPIVRQIAWISLAPQFAILFGLFAIFHRVNAEYSVLLGAAAYLLILVGVRNLIPRDHRKAMRLFRKERFAEAILLLNRSYQFFTNHAWIDNWRYIVLLSSSRISYREMALLNMAFCYGQIGEGGKSREFYERVLREFPGSKLAEAALRMLEAAKSVA